MSIHTANFTIAQAAKATGISPNTLRAWFQRGHMLLNEDDKAPEADGLARIVTGRTVLQIGITAALMNYGMSVASAFRAAAAFAVIGDRNIDGVEREPGQLWGRGHLSMLVVPGGENGADHADVVRWLPKDAAQLIIHRDFHKTGGVMLPLDGLVAAIRKNLGLGPDTGVDD